MRDVFVPAVFPIALSISFFLFTLLHGPRRASSLDALHLPLQALVHTERYDAGVDVTYKRTDIVSI
jgi:hypothetical protein